MKQATNNVTCPFHGLDYRMDVCHECARIKPTMELVSLEITDEDRGALRIVVRPGNGLETVVLKNS